MKHKSIQLYASDSNHNLQYQGKCKLQINRLSSMLIVEPEHEEYEIKSAKFECGFVMNKNVLFVVGEQEVNDFVLIFDEKERCKKVYDMIMEDKVQSDVKEEMLFDKLRLHSVPKKVLILRPPDFELMEDTHNGVNKLFIFDPNDRSLCYTFSFDKRSGQRYYCQGCHNKKVFEANVKRNTVALCKDKNGDYYVRSNDSIHACEPTKYEPEKYAKKEIHKCYDYFFFRNINWPNSVNVAIHHPDDKTLCYHLNYNKSRFRFRFRCNGCITKERHLFYTTIKKDENGREYFSHDYKKHICQPINVSSICAPKYVILKREEINFEEKEKKKPQINESKIIKSECFELCLNQKSVPDALLLIYNSHGRNIGYKFNYNKYRKYYAC